MFIPFIHFNNGEAREAIKFYSEVFEYELKETDIVIYDKIMPGKLDYNYKNYIAHSHIITKFGNLMISDCEPGKKMPIGDNFSISINLPDYQDIEKIYDNLKKDSKDIFMELSKTPWSEGYAMLKDKFGIIWQLNTEADMQWAKH